MAHREEGGRQAARGETDIQINQPTHHCSLQTTLPYSASTMLLDFILLLLTIKIPSRTRTLLELRKIGVHEKKHPHHDASQVVQRNCDTARNEPVYTLGVPSTVVTVEQSLRTRPPFHKRKSTKHRWERCLLTFNFTSRRCG